ncbi:hypothetical protein [Campylobacter ureolyticus]|uniref:hypothetical protein n=1 Tax=Campylobacter ureolyticus TaxID=827 RepID=UPI0022B2F5B7|nr:hypothetical protein [Campylobacter ureolyticus]MCZ6172333.1 hypothetical protein [Campylobacter ureolyticus]
MKKLVLLIFIVSFSFGFGCYKPTIPMCVEDYYGNFNSKSDFEMCKMEVENYTRDLQEYIQCLEEEINEAIEEQNEVIKKFNCKARGDSYCY